MLFNASERKGVFLLLLLIIGTIVLPRRFLAKEADFFLLPAEIIGDTIFIKADSNSSQVIKTFTRQTKRTISIELNTADRSSLVQVKGIGPYYAAKIIRYRNQLGGFYTVKQLNDLKMKYFNVDSCAHLFRVDTTLIRVSDLDTMSFKAVLRHPYLAYEDVQLIFNARQKYGHLSYRLLEEHKILTTYKLKKIKPYFK
ncbi:MAG: helix-hairpin-helix domain-containing protein [Odoribacter sp.]|nr:helix-hairpin-helix domain-containing protein [Odoribacter sp.]